MSEKEKAGKAHRHAASVQLGESVLLQSWKQRIRYQRLAQMLGNTAERLTRQGTCPNPQ